MEAYLEFLISGYLNLFNAQPLSISDAPWYSNGDLISKYVSYFCMFLALIFVPGVCLYVLNHELYEFEHLEKKWGVLFEGIKITSKTNASFYLFFVLRRLIFVNLAFFVYQYPSF